MEDRFYHGSGEVVYPSFDISLVDGTGVVLYIFQVLIGVRI